MNTLFIIASLSFFIWTLRNVLFWTFLWQIKEYRLDRLRVHFKETTQGRDLFWGRAARVKWFVIFVYPVVIFSENLLFPYQIAITVIFAFQALGVAKEFFDRSLKRPKFTPKVSFIAVFTLSVLSLLFFLPVVDKFLWLILLDKLPVFFIASVVFFLSFPTELYRDWQVRRAIQKIRENKKLLVIGVTGSYGKSSTKEFIGRILAQKFKVIKTPGTNNTPVGVAKTILSRLTPETEIFVVEMGAYKRGEIAEICGIVRPRIGVLTGISLQHLSLFGSLKNILEGKYELIKSLPKKGGLAIFNGNNSYCSQLYKKTRISKLIYSFNKASDIKVSNIKVNPLSLSFGVKINKEEVIFRIKALGKHNVENLLPAILIARHLGMSLGEIKKAASKIDYLPMTMEPTKGRSDAILVDDTFNASPDAVLAAIEYMRVFKGKKILILQPMIELGREAGKSHYEVGRAVGKFLTRVFLTNRNFALNLEKGVKESNSEAVVEVGSVDRITTYVENLTQKGDVVVFEGKETAAVLQKLAYV